VKKLILLRHAKSSWDDPTLEDINRPLSKRGVYSAKLMREFIINKFKNEISNIYSSPSKRTKSTCDLVFNKNITINYEKELYTFNFQDLINWLKNLGDKNNILIVGHNPALLDLIQYLSKKEETILMPTCSLCEIHLNINSWNDIKKKCGVIQLMQKVKSLKNYNFKK
jgi:phosphohistidine phosphatase